MCRLPNQTLDLGHLENKCPRTYITFRQFCFIPDCCRTPFQPLVPLSLTPAPPPCLLKFIELLSFLNDRANILHANIIRRLLSEISNLFSFFKPSQNICWFTAVYCCLFSYADVVWENDLDPIIRFWAVCKYRNRFSRIVLFNKKMVMFCVWWLLYWTMAFCLCVTTMDKLW